MTSLLQKINEVNERVDNISTQVCCIVSRSAGTVVNTGSILPFNSVSHNVGGGFNSSTNRFTCPIPGRYIFSVGFFTNGNNTYLVDIKINGVTYDRHERLSTGTEGNAKKYMVVIAVLSVGDVVYAQCDLGSVRLFASNLCRFYGCLLE
jgi:hypothetical protein